MKRAYLAIDLGAESGRLMLGTLCDGKLSLEEIHRFPNQPLHQGPELHWDIESLFAQVLVGLRKVSERRIPVVSISTDSWGLDYVLFDAAGAIIPPTFHYRDPRTALGVEKVRARVPWPEVFEQTGIQFMPFNTLYQLAAENPERLSRAQLLLPIADAFNFRLSGVARAEESLASTTQLFNPRDGQWSERLIQAMDFPRPIFPPIVPGGTRLGKLLPEIVRATGLEPLEVVAGCSHDTAAAVAAIPARDANWAYISSGTWSLMGTELAAPLLTEQCRQFNFTNEIGFGGTVRLLKNIIGLWIVQECRREWARQGKDWDYETLMRMAANADSFTALINPNDSRFVGPGDMPDKISAYCRETKQHEPETPGAIIRCVLESLALLYRRTLEDLQQLTGFTVGRLHIVGGGSKNQLLNRFTANALRIPVVAGPVEATALGNILVQAISAGDFASLRAGRETIARSFDTSVFHSDPAEEKCWAEAYIRFRALP